ncbi:carbamoyltransferase [candidate division WWE3 bacterium]|nr:carbamoyltransferase [candidate division WWE3 bacterium]
MSLTDNNYILGISAFYHDSAAALLKNGEIICAAHEERFTRKKHDPAFPTNAVKFCLEFAKIDLNNLDSVVFYDKSFRKFERLLETYYAFAPKGLISFLSAIPVWIKEKLFLKELINKELKQIQETFGKTYIQPKILFSDHHLSHAASAFYPSPFKEAAILTIDGVGEWATASISYGDGKSIKVLKEMSFPNSVGFLYSAFTYFLGFKVNSGEYKLMGLAPYGDPTSENLPKFKELIKTHIVKIKDDGSIWLNQDYFDYCTGLKMIVESRWEKLFSFGRKKEEDTLEQFHCDLALAIQQITDEIVLKMARTAKSLTKSNNLCLAGGVALNCVSTSKITKEKIFENMWIQPAAGDAGGALGCALAAYHLSFDKPRNTTTGKDAMNGSYLGPEFSQQDIEKEALNQDAPYKYYEDFEELLDVVSSLMMEGKVVGWFQGRMEWGPRALGNRSIVGDARNPEMQKKLNLKIKFREGFRPFAPSVMEEETKEFFDFEGTSPYMLLVADVAPKRRNPLPDNFHKLSLKEKLYFTRSDIPSITHLDYSARLQTVSKETNPKYWKLINTFKKKTGYGVIVNTSFNVRGEPIVCSPKDAYMCFVKTEMDFLVMGNYLFDKVNQPTTYKKYSMEDTSKTD